ncbi:MAG: long-chain-fatty-acid--CoA ligase [Chloroflexota bacterium]
MDTPATPITGQQELASFATLDPFTFLERSAFVHPAKPAVVYGERTITYAELRERVNRLGGALRQAGVGYGDRVAYLVPNVPAMLEGHFGPMAIGAVLVAINTRLGEREVAYILNHCGAKVLVFDAEYAPLVRRVLPQATGVTTCVQVTDDVPLAADIPGPDYEAFLASAPVGTHREPLRSELDAVAIDYTSGTTGQPKGVVYHGRGAYLNALSVIIETRLSWRSVYLWTLPMFHCNGWCHTWAVTAAMGTHVCLRRVDPAQVYGLIASHAITNICAAPTVLTGLYASPAAQGQDLSRLTIVTGGAPPAPQVLRTMEGMGATVMHMYGLTETFGPYTISPAQPEWDAMSVEERSFAKSRQGVPNIHVGLGLRVVDSQMQDVARDAQQMGEVVMRGNGVMSGYYDDREATEKAFAGGWFHSGDLAVWHPDGQIELKDRAKDIIISGGENISSQEVEAVLMEHPAVLEVCVIGVPDKRWGEVPKAFVVPRAGAQPTADELIAFCRERIAHFKAPKHVAFGELPKTATGKIQKFVLREQEWAGHERRIQGSQV